MYIILFRKVVHILLYYWLKGRKLDRSRRSRIQLQLYQIRTTTTKYYIVHQFMPTYLELCYRHLLSGYVPPFLFDNPQLSTSNDKNVSYLIFLPSCAFHCLFCDNFAHTPVFWLCGFLTLQICFNLLAIQKRSSRLLFSKLFCYKKHQ